MALDPVAATAALVDAINALRVVEEPCSDALRSAWRDDGAIWTVNWAESLGRDIANAAAALERAEAEGATDQGATEIENALWRVDAAFEKLHDVIALGLGVPALKLNPNKKGIRRFESDRRENRKKLRELAADHKAAGAILEIDERINNHRFLALRHQMTHSLAPILAWRSLIWFEVGEIDDKGGVVAYSSHHLTPAHELQTSVQPDQLFGRTIADGRDVIGLLISAMNKLTDLFRATGELPPPPVLWRVRRTGELFFDRSEASRAARDAASPAAGDADSS